MAQTLLDLDSIMECTLDGLCKGIAANAEPFALKDIAGKGWNLLNGDMSLPIAVLKEPALENNSRWMRDFTRASGVQICPHGKTTMCPQLFELQLQDGAWGMTAATATHVAVYTQHGIRRIILANQLIGATDIAFVCAQLKQYPDLDFYCLVDSIENVQALARELSDLKACRPVQVLLEIGMPGGRSGVRTTAQAHRLATEIKEHPQLALRGIEAFEGIVDLFNEEGRLRIDSMLGNVLETAALCEQDSLFAEGEVLLSAGGSACFDWVADRLKSARLERGFEVIIRSGCYLTHDHGFYGRLVEDLRIRSDTAASLDSDLQPALELWAWVQSLPEAGLAIISLGKRDAGADISPPEALKIYRPGRDSTPQDLPECCETVAMNDQHLFLKIPPTADIKIGDMLGFGVSHPCTTIDKWRILYGVDNNYSVTSALKTFF